MLIYPDEKSPNESPSSSTRNRGFDEDLPPAYDGRRSQPPPPRSSQPSSSASGSTSRFATPTPASLLSPPPPGFTRTPSTAPHATYAPFSPISLLSLGHDLGNGWPLLPPPSPTTGGGVHPFVTHDVLEEDWTRLLSDLGQLGKLSGVNRVVAGVAPMAMGVGLLPGLFISRGIEKRMRKKKVGPVCDVVEQWNHHYFRPRLMEITLSQGDPTIQYDSDSSSSSSSSSASSNRGATRDARRARRAARRQERRDRRQKKREKKKRTKEPWRLTVSYVPLQQQGYFAQGAGGAYAPPPQAQAGGAFAPPAGPPPGMGGMGMQQGPAAGRSPY